MSGAFWADGLGFEAVVLGEVKKFRVPVHLSVFPSADGCRLHVVVENALRHALEVVKHVHVAPLQDRFMGFPHKLDVQHTGPAQDHREAPQLSFRAPHFESAKVTPIHLSLLTWIRFIPNSEVGLALRTQRFHEIF